MEISVWRNPKSEQNFSNTEFFDTETDTFFYAKFFWYRIQYFWLDVQSDRNLLQFILLPSCVRPFQIPIVSTPPPQLAVKYKILALCCLPTVLWLQHSAPAFESATKNVLTSRQTRSWWQIKSMSP